LLYGGWMNFKCNYFGWIQYRGWYKIKREGYECKDSFHGRMCVGALPSVFYFTSHSSIDFSRMYVCWCTHITLSYYITFFYIVQNWNNTNNKIRNKTTVAASAPWNFTHSFPSYLTYLHNYLSNSLYFWLLQHGKWMYFQCNYFGRIQCREWYKINLERLEQK